MEDFGDSERDSAWQPETQIQNEPYWQPDFQGTFGPEDHAIVLSHHSFVDYTQFRIPVPLSIVENTVFPVQAVAGIEPTALQPHDPYYETVDYPFGRDDFTYDTNWTSLVLNQSHDETSIPPAPETEEVMNDLLEGNHSNDIKSFSRSDRTTKSTAQVWTCVVCHQEVATYNDLKRHASSWNHATLKCRVQSCTHVHLYQDQTYRNHLKTFHPNVYECQQCNVSFASQLLLEEHASQSGHASFICDHQDCGKTFSRLDTYQRHQKVHQEEAERFSCKYCKKYRGANGFKRKDHLTQHIRGYHHIGEDEALNFSRGYSCKEKGCSEYRELNNKWDASHAFTKRPDYVKHMRTVHDTSEYPCPEPGCERVGGKGYFRVADLRAHLKKVHDITNVVIKDIGFP